MEPVGGSEIDCRPLISRVVEDHLTANNAASCEARDAQLQPQPQEQAVAVGTAETGDPDDYALPALYSSDLISRGVFNSEGWMSRTEVDGL